MEEIKRDFMKSCPIFKECMENSKLPNNLLSSTLDYAYEVIWLELALFIRNHLVPKFWLHFNQGSKDTNLLNDSNYGLLDADKMADITDKIEANKLQYTLFTNFVKAVNDLYDCKQFIVECLEQLYRGTNGKYHIEVIQRLNDQYRHALLAQLPTNFQNTIYAFYDVSFRVFFKLHEDENTSNTNGKSNSQIYNYNIDDDIKSLCSGCSNNNEECQCRNLSNTIDQINQKLYEMELLDRLAGQTLTTLVMKRIKEYIRSMCSGIYNRTNLNHLLKWLDTVIINWLTQVFQAKNFKTDDEVVIDETRLKTTTNNVIENLKVKLTFSIYEHYALSMIDHFFNIIIDFPDSTPAIEDLKVCMEKINLRKQIVTNVKHWLVARILHPGVNTMDILTTYVAAIKAIHCLDSSGVMLETITAPIKEYLRKRSDTVRCVVTSLTEEGPTDLSEELAKADAVKDNDANNSNGEIVDWESWQPEPVNIENYTNKALTTNTVRSADVISMVVDIYGSKELFMNEYRNLLADRLITQLELNPEKEIRNLELLKLRFGDSLLHNCGVMLKDIADSKRINAHIQNDSKYLEDKKFDISSLIISAQFWPSFNKESIELPEEIAKEFEKYTKAYEEYKGNRTLNWRTITGRVTIVIEMGERIMEMTVPPTQAIIIYHFQNKSEWSLDDLSTIVKIPASILRRRLAFWQSHGLIIESSPNIYRLQEDNNLGKNELEQMPIAELLPEDEEYSESAMASASDQREEELQVFWSYIVGMLTNLDSLPIDRIHQMLKLFATNSVGIEFSQDELKEFLQRKVRDHKLIYAGGVYQLAK